jgi:hypothetical protein
VREQSDRSKEDKVENLSNQEKAAHVLAGAIERHIEAQQAATPAETVAETVTQ